jgi:Transposase
MPALAAPVTVGVDTHLETHVAAVVDQTGRLLGTKEFAASTRGYVALVTWAERFGTVEPIGVEGTGTYGAGLARFVRAYGLPVVEVNRPDRSLRRRRGKSDPIDAQAAARSTLAGVAATAPKTREGQVEMIRVLRVARRGAHEGQGGSRSPAVRGPRQRPRRAPSAAAGLKTKALVGVCAATARPTTPCGASRWSGCAATHRPERMWNGAPSKGCPSSTSCAVSSATSPARSTTTSPASHPALPPLAPNRRHQPAPQA